MKLEIDFGSTIFRLVKHFFMKQYFAAGFSRERIIVHIYRHFGNLKKVYLGDLRLPNFGGERETKCLSPLCVCTHMFNRNNCPSINTHRTRATAAELSTGEVWTGCPLPVHTSAAHSSVVELLTAVADEFVCLYQGNLIQGKARLALKNWKNLFGDQRKDSLTILEVCYLL